MIYFLQNMHSTSARSAICGCTLTAWVVGLLLAATVQSGSRSSNLTGIYPPAGTDGHILYAMVRPVPELASATPTSGDGIVQVFVTGRDSRVEGTASHYFALPPEVPGRIRLGALRSAPGPNHFIRIDDREYALTRIAIGSEGGRLRLEGATLERTGFLSRIIRGRIRLRFDAPLGPGDLANDMTVKALEDTAGADRIAREGYEKALRDHRARHESD